MRTADHRRLGQYLLREIEEYKNLPLLHKISFIWGNIEPDINYVTYLKGFSENKKFQGHHSQNGMKHIKKLTEKIEGKPLNVITCYRAGKLTHYIADAFTFPHNDGFTGNIKNHMSYERRLHCKFYQYLDKASFHFQVRTQEPDPWTAFACMHARYISSRKTQTDDIEYMLRAAGQVLISIAQRSVQRKRVYGPFMVQQNNCPISEKISF